MSLPLSQLTAIRAELDSNPGLYGPLSNSEVATELMAVDKVQIRATISGPEVFEATDPAEFQGEQSGNRSEWLALCAIEAFSPANGSIMVQTAQRIFGGASQTAANLIEARNETVSRAQQIGVGNVTTEDVRLARAL